MSFLKKGPKCHTNVRKPQCDHMAIYFSQFLEFFEIMARISYLHLKMSPTQNFGENKRPKIDSTLKKGPKCCKQVRLENPNGTWQYFLLFFKML